jgi:hypothetical protein
MTLLFWTLMVLSLIFSGLAIGSKKARFLMISLILILPLSLYLVLTPRFEGWGFLFPFFLIGAAVALKKKLIWLSILFVSPNFILIGWLGYVILAQ